MRVLPVSTSNVSIHPAEAAQALVLDLTLQPARQLSGTVAGPDGQPLSGFKVIGLTAMPDDDVLDGASIRRHAPTANAAWGNQTSVLLGDYLFTHAFHLASTLGDAETISNLLEKVIAPENGRYAVWQFAALV